MDNYESLEIESCMRCPLMNDEHLFCTHPRPLPTAPDFPHLTPAEASGQDHPPVWCPLRSAALLVHLK